MRSYRKLVVVLVACCCWGCDDGRPETAPVRGVVELDGQPITTADFGGVVVTPRGGRLAKGKLESDGSFRLSTYGDGDGAITGPARVGVSATMDEPGSSPEEKYQQVRWIIPRDFGSGDTSGLTCEVQPGVENVWRIRLSSDGTGTIDVE